MVRRNQRQFKHQVNIENDIICALNHKTNSLYYQIFPQSQTLILSALKCDITCSSVYDIVCKKNCLAQMIIKIHRSALQMALRYRLHSVTLCPVLGSIQATEQERKKTLLRYLLEKAIDATASTIAPRFTLLYKTLNKLCVYNIMHTEQYGLC